MSDPSRSELAQYILAGTDSAAAELDRAFRTRLCRLVEREMSRRYQPREGAEDVVQSVLRTFFRRNARGEFQFEHDGALWRLLQEIARRKTLKHVEYHQAQARDPVREESLECDHLADRSLEELNARLLGDALEMALAGLPPPEPEIHCLQLHGYSLGEIVERVLCGLDHPYPDILRRRLQGESENQIAQALGCGRQTVRGKLKRIQERLAKVFADRERS